MTTPSGSGGSRRWHAELAWLPGTGVQPDVLIEAAGDRFRAITPRTPAESVPPGTVRLAGFTMPALANAHSHAFHRALRGITQTGRGTFWTWRERMYEVAAALDPDSYLALARATYAEMALAGIGCVGEFHYLHHDAGGARYADENAMGRALIEAADQAGVRLTLLDTCYLSGGLGPGASAVPLAGPQLRFGDGTADAWAERASALAADDGGLVESAVKVGAAIHSVRAVPAGQMPVVAAWAKAAGAPLHVHLSEQVAENEACQAAYGATPSAVLAEAGVLGPRTSVVHATHLTEGDIALLGSGEVFACACPTTEADLADGIGPFAALAAAGCRLTAGSDSHAVIDLFEEARRIEMYERLASRQRGHFTAEALATAVTWDGHASLGWPDAGEIAVGSLADLVTISLDSPRLAGLAVPAAARSAASAAGPGSASAAPGSASARPGAASAPPGSASAGPGSGVLETVIFAGGPPDVRNVVIGGRDVVADGRHLLVEDVPQALSAAIREVFTGLA